MGVGDAARMPDEHVDVLSVDVSVEDVWVVRLAVLDSNDRFDKFVVHLNTFSIPSKAKVIIRNKVT